MDDKNARKCRFDILLSWKKVNIDSVFIAIIFIYINFRDLEARKIFEEYIKHFSFANTSLDDALR